MVLSQKDVSWAGLKDRHAVTEQWLSVHLQKVNLTFSAFLAQYPSIEILATARHNKKLRPGDLVVATNSSGFVRSNGLVMMW